MYPIILVIAVLFACASCFPQLEGSSVKAQLNRNRVASELLDKVSPDDCAYAPFGEIYGWCKDPGTVELINKRVDNAKKNIIEYIKNNPDLSNTHVFFQIVLEDLYFCRDIHGSRLTIGNNIIYCETKLSSVLEKRFQNNDIEYMGLKNNKYIYKIRWDGKM